MTDPSLVRAARRAWSGLESLHVVGYFADETRDQYVALGCTRDCRTSRRAWPRWARSDQR
jgi:hypothetical protein